MSATGLNVFDRTLQTTNIWLREIMDALDVDRQIAWHVLSAVLHTLRDRLTLEVAAHLGAQLPLMVRGAYYDRFRPDILPMSWRTRDEFVELVAGELRQIPVVEPGEAIGAVFAVLSRHIDPGQIEKVRHTLPSSIRQTWDIDPDAFAAGSAPIAQVEESLILRVDPVGRDARR